MNTLERPRVARAEHTTSVLLAASVTFAFEAGTVATLSYTRGTGIVTILRITRGTICVLSL